MHRPVTGCKRGPCRTWWRARWWTRSMRTFLCEAGLSAVRALGGAGAPPLVPGMHRFLNAAPAGALGSGGHPLWGLDEVAHFQAGSQAPLMDGALQLTGKGSARHSTAALRPSCTP